MMGSSSSRDTRRISFENSITLIPPLSLERTIDEVPAVRDHRDENLMRQCTEMNEIDDTVTYWNKRVDNLKAEHQLINKIIDQEYENTINKANDLSKAPQKVDKKKIKRCFDLRSKMLKCYEENQHQPLVCGDAVRAFGSCVAACKADN